MKAKIQIGITLLCVAAFAMFALQFNFNSHDRSVVDNAPRIFAGALVPNAEAQTPPIPTAIAVTAYATTTGAGAMDMLAAPATGTRNYVYQVQCVNSSASTQAVAFIKDGSTTLWAVGCPPASTANGVVNFNPPLRQPTSATKLTMTASTAVTTAYFNMSGFTAR